jgi:hypothetical protein
LAKTKSFTSRQRRRLVSTGFGPRSGERVYDEATNEAAYRFCSSPFSKKYAPSRSHFEHGGAPLAGNEARSVADEAAGLHNTME